MEFFNILQSGLVISGLIAASVLIIIALRGEMNRSDPVWVVFLIALIIRVPLAIILYHTLPHDWLDIDWMKYERIGREMAETGTIDPVVSAGFSAIAHGFLNASVYWLIGFQPVVVRVFSAVTGALTCALLYLFLERLSRSTLDAQIGALVVTFWPTFVAWSMSNSKEMTMAALGIGIFYCALALSERFRLSVAAMMTLLAIATCFMRVYMALLILPVVMTYIIVVWVTRNCAQSLSAVAILMWALIVAAPVAVGLNYVMNVYNLVGDGLTALNLFRSAVAEGGAQLQVEPFYSIYDLLLYIPEGVANYFLRPFPWNVGSLNQTLGAFMMLLYYPFLITTIRTIPGLWRRERAFAAFFIVQIMVLAVAHGIMEGNMGSLMRHRVYIEVLILGMGVTYFVRALRRRRSGHGESVEGTICSDQRSAE